jgi:hypothetical protein
MAKRVSLDVVRKVVRGGTSKKRAGVQKNGLRRAPSYLVRRLSTYFFQIRPPASLDPADGPCPPIRVRLGVLPRWEAQRRAAWLGTMAQASFGQWRRHMQGGGEGVIPSSDVGFPKGNGPEEFLANMMTFLKDSAAKLEKSAPPNFSPDDLRIMAAIQEAVVIEQEVAKGAQGHPIVVSRADFLRQDIWNRWSAGQGHTANGSPLADAIGKLADVADRQLALMAQNDDQTSALKQSPPIQRPAPHGPAIEPLPSPSAPQPAAQTSTALLFSQIEEEYIKLRQDAGAADGTISTIRTRTNVFKTLVGDRPIDCYMPVDLQNYVNTIQYLPLELTRQGENTQTLLALGLHEAIKQNKERRCWEPIGIKTMQDGYVQIVRAIVSNAVGLHRLNDPFQGLKIRWPANAKPSVKREAMGYEKLNDVFKLGLDSGYLDDAMLGPLALLSTRRIGILPWIRGCDFDEKHGVGIVRVNGIVFDKSKNVYFRVPYKTSDTLRFFVLHDMFRKIGFVDWAKAQGDAFLFRLLQQCSDPSDAASKRINNLMKRGGAKGMNIEVGHSLRHGGKDLLIEEDIDSEATRLQMGHQPNDVHSGYGGRAELRRKQCQELARFDLPKEVDWSMFEGLDSRQWLQDCGNLGAPRKQPGDVTQIGCEAIWGGEIPCVSAGCRRGIKNCLMLERRFPSCIRGFDSLRPVQESPAGQR